MTDEIGGDPVLFMSGRDAEVVYEATTADCTCPGFTYRRTCAHVIQLQRWKEWNMAVPTAQPLPPPPGQNAWQRTL